MRLFAPRYYESFKCIADKCKHSCCIGWEIDIDECTLERYRLGGSAYCDSIMESIEYADVPHFRLCHDRCPHLTREGLCRIITELGEEWLTDICREHPRFYNDTPRGIEVGLGMACEVAARLVLECENYRETVEIGSVCEETEPFDFDTVAEREKIYALLSDITIPYEKRLLSLWKKYRVSPKLLSDEIWREIIGSLEYLDSSHTESFSVYSSDEATPHEYEIVLERFLAYLIYRHATPKKTEKQFCAALGFAFFSERLLASMLKQGKVCDTGAIYELVRIVSEELEYSEANTDSIMLEFEFI